MVYFKPEDAFSDPYLSAHSMIYFNQLKDMGYDLPKDVITKLKSYLVNLLKMEAFL
jgi:hypothetical protein